MEPINGLRRFEVQFNADGSFNTEDGGDGGLAAAVATGGITDLYVMAHGWNNGMASARALYDAMFGLLMRPAGRPPGDLGRRRDHLAVHLVPRR